MHINDIDLNLLRVFDAVYRIRNVSRAAETLGMTQPATSQSLTRLRLLLKDPLFIRVAGGVAPTPKARRLAHGILTAIETFSFPSGPTVAICSSGLRISIFSEVTRSLALISFSPCTSNFI